MPRTRSVFNSTTIHFYGKKMPHSLVEIPHLQWPELRELYRELRNISCNTMQCFIDWKQQSNEVDIKIFALDGEWQKDGTYIGIINSPITSVFIDTLNEDQQRLLMALNTMNMKRPYIILGYPERLTTTVEQHYVDMGFERQNFQPHGVFLHHVEREVAQKLIVDVPEGYTLRRLETKHAELVNSLWPLRQPGSVEFVKLLITYNDSVGVFDHADNLVAWCLLLPMGALGLLQVLDTHKRLGLGSLAVRYMAKQVAARGLEVIAPVVCDNVASLTLFKKLGFQIIGRAFLVELPVGK